MLHTQLHIKEEYTKHYICYTLNCIFKKNTQNTTYVTHSIAYLRRIHKTLHMLHTQLHI